MLVRYDGLRSRQMTLCAICNMFWVHSNICLGLVCRGAVLPESLGVNVEHDSYFALALLTFHPGEVSPKSRPRTR